jgi:hypothetical protein
MIFSGERLDDSTVDDGFPAGEFSCVDAMANFLLNGCAEKLLPMRTWFKKR